MKIITPITQNEAFYLRSHGFRVDMTGKGHKSRSKKYFAREDQKLQKALQIYRESLKN